jgi:hypothetical protein
VAVPCVTVAQRPDAAAEVGHTIRHFSLEAYNAAGVDSNLALLLQPL